MPLFLCYELLVNIALFNSYPILNVCCRVTYFLIQMFALINQLNYLIMSEKMFEYAKGKFVNPKKVIAVNAYEKDGKWRAAIDVDVVSKDKATLYSDAFEKYADSINYIANFPTN